MSTAYPAMPAGTHTRAAPVASGFDWLEPESFPVWRKRLDLERRAGNLTPARMLALRALLSFVGADGLFPSDAAVAGLSGLSVSTVQRARRDARALGLLKWERTRKLVDGRWRQGSNRYTIAIPERPVCSDSQTDRRGRKKEERRLTSKQPVAAPVVPANLPSLASVAKTRQAAFADRWQASRGAGRPTAGVQPGGAAHAARL
jgi:hypothetical protein